MHTHTLLLLCPEYDKLHFVLRLYLCFVAITSRSTLIWSDITYYVPIYGLNQSA